MVGNASFSVVISRVSRQRFGLRSSASLLPVRPHGNRGCVIRIASKCTRRPAPHRHDNPLSALCFCLAGVSNVAASLLHSGMGLTSSTPSYDPEKDIPDLTGKVALVSGGNTGLGYYTVAHLVKHGAKVRYIFLTSPVLWKPWAF